jgi:hypothetical protein
VSVDQSPTPNSRIYDTVRNDDTYTSHYKMTFSNKNSDTKKLNIIRSKDIVDKEKLKEYSYPPLPNLVNAK